MPLEWQARSDYSDLDARYELRVIHVIPKLSRHVKYTQKMRATKCVSTFAGSWHLPRSDAYSVFLPRRAGVFTNGLIFIALTLQSRTSIRILGLNQKSSELYCTPLWQHRGSPMGLGHFIRWPSCSTYWTYVGRPCILLIVHALNP